ncbi:MULTISPECIES: DUF2510 domain-containing protein [Actinomadura]|uniref:DUF2510 domain-containing protein n=1 Tax=Actinomadura TaxID=1988 RepID=UPI001BE4A1EB|nr:MULTISPECIES: DUF2510 domain-containing protein [Actinomadura]MBT2213892.1 DUF2510 domain-containing protein [Actinomadura sp. NEAU-AAG7]
MSQPGWYPDPYGTGSLRWWDGQVWTERLNPEPPGPPRTRRPERSRRRAEERREQEPYYSAPLGQRNDWGRQPAVQAVDVNVRGLRLHADDELLSYGTAVLGWPRVEWVAYWAAEVASGYGQQTTTQWVFQAGRFPFHGGPRVEVVIEPDAMPGRPLGPEGEPERIWGRLIELCQVQAEQRLVSELAGRVRAGESIDVAQGLTVHPGGVRGNRVSLSWTAISSATVDGGRVWIHQSSSAAPVLYVPQQNPNAVLIPALLAQFKQ